MPEAPIVRCSSDESVPFAPRIGLEEWERRADAVTLYFCSEEIVERELGNLLIDLAGSVPAAVVREVVSAARDDLDGQVPPGALPEFLHRSAVQRLEDYRVHDR